MIKNKGEITLSKHELEKLSIDYLNQKEISKATLKAYRLAFKFYIDYLKENDILYAKTSDVIKYRAYRKSLGHSSEYIYIHITALKGLYKYLKINQRSLNLSVLYRYDIMASIKNERINYHIKKPILTKEDAKYLINYTKNRRIHMFDYRNHAIIYLMITSGIRSVEAIFAMRSDYKIADDRHILYIEKNHSFVNLSKGAIIALNEYLDLRKDKNPYLFVSHHKLDDNSHLSVHYISHMFRKLIKTSKLSHLGLTPHSLRHAVGAFNLLRGASLIDTKNLLRHKNIKSTLIYQEHIKKMSESVEEKLEAFILKEEHLTYYNDFISYLESEI
ncbi:MAG: site-specific integrase [Acholeplasmataceae bacterium]|nr:site-specific integrase [Acholeplasmataceae bacterium]